MAAWTAEAHNIISLSMADVHFLFAGIFVIYMRISSCIYSPLNVWSNVFIGMVYQYLNLCLIWFVTDAKHLVSRWAPNEEAMPIAIVKLASSSAHC